MDHQIPEVPAPTCLRVVIGVLCGALPLGLLFVCTLLVCTPAFPPAFWLTAGVFLLDVVGFLSYWWLRRRSANACGVMALYFYFALVFMLGWFLFLGSFTCGFHLQL